MCGGKDVTSVEKRRVLFFLSGCDLHSIYWYVQEPVTCVLVCEVTLFDPDLGGDFFSRVTLCVGCMTN